MRTGTPGTGERRRVWPHILRAIRFSPGLYFLTTIQEVIVFTGFSLAFGVLIRLFFDSVEAGAVAGFTPLTVCAYIFGAAAARAIIFFTNFWAFFRYQGALAAWIQGNLFRCILRKPGAQALPDSPGEAISRFRGDVKIIGDILEKLNFLIEWTIFAVVGMIIMLRIQPLITVIVVIPLSIIVFAASLAKKWIQKFHREAREATGKVTGFIAELFGTAQTIKTASAEERVIARLKRLGEDRRQKTVREEVLSQILRSITRDSVSLGTGLILIASAGAMRSGAFSVGDFALFIVYMEMVTDFISHIGDYITMFRKSVVSLGRLTDLIGDSSPSEITRIGNAHLAGPLPEVKQPDRSGVEPLQSLLVSRLSFQYPGSTFGIRDVSFHIEAGELAVITGRIGSGKSTLLKAVLGLIQPDSGSVSWNNVVLEPTADFVPPRTAFTPQVPILFSETARNNLLLGLRTGDDTLNASIKLAVLDGDVGALPEGLDTLIGVKGVRLSGGQRQRLAAARMLVREPELIVFDDLSSALDVETEKALWQRLFAVHKRTYLVVSHRRTVLKSANRIIVLKDGSIEAVGKHEQLLKSSAEYQKIWGVQKGMQT